VGGDEAASSCDKDFQLNNPFLKTFFAKYAKAWDKHDPQDTIP